MMPKPHKKSKTQRAYEGTLSADPAALDHLVRLGIHKCREKALFPPRDTDTEAETKIHRIRRQRTNRYQWIQDWLLDYLKPRPRPKGETGAGVLQRLEWRLMDEMGWSQYRNELRREGRPPRPEGTRVRREKLPSKEDVLTAAHSMPELVDPVLHDLWCRILDIYPKRATNEHLAVITGVSRNVLSSRRAALAAIRHQQVSDEDTFLLRHCLGLKIGRVRKTEVRRIEAQLGPISREELVTTLRETGEFITFMDWGPRDSRVMGPDGKGRAQGMPIKVPVMAQLEPTPVRINRPARCPVIDKKTAEQCIYTVDRCPIHNRPSI